MPDFLTTPKVKVDAGPRPARLLRAEDLHDARQFITHVGVPILDVNDDPEHGEVDEDLLKLIVANTNKRFTEGKFPELAIGHSRHKNTVIIRDGAKSTIYPATDEENQPPIVGYASNFRILPYQGRPCCHADFHVHNEHAEHVKRFVHRSVERLAPNPDKNLSKAAEREVHAIDRIALLATPPRRDLGVLRYERDPALLRICSAAPGSPECSCDPDALPDKKRIQEEATVPDPTATADPQVDPAGGDTAGQDDQMNQPITSLTIGDLMGLMEHTITTTLQQLMAGEEEPAPEGEGETEAEAEAAPMDEPAPEEEPEPAANYEDGAALMSGAQDEDEEGDTSTSSKAYADGAPTCAGGSNTMIPGFGGIGKPKEKRMPYEKTIPAPTAPAPPVAVPQTNSHSHSRAHANGKDRVSAVTTLQYAKDMEDQGEMNQYLFDQVVSLLTEKRVNLFYERVSKIRGDGYVIPEEQVAKIVGKIAYDTPETYEDEVESEIRACYGRQAVGVPPIPVGGHPFARHVPKGAPDMAETKRATAYAMKHGVDLNAALKAIREPAV